MDHCHIQGFSNLSACLVFSRDRREADVQAIQKAQNASRAFSNNARTMGRKIPNAIPWAKSDARKVLLGDIENDVFPDDIPVLHAWERIYSKMKKFEDVPYLQFVERVDAH